MAPADACQKRDQLVADGYTVIPEVFGEDLLQVLRDWSEDYFSRHQVDRRYRYQGSAVNVFSPSRWARGDIPVGDKSEIMDRKLPDPIVDRFLYDPGLQMACASLQLEGLKSSDEILRVLSKPAHGPPLYWHQDFINWNSPIAATPWPTYVFLSTYLTDTSVANGCLRVIPGTHLRRIDLHEMIPDAHGEDARALEIDSPAFMDHPDAVDLPMRAGDLVVADGRLLHAAHPNTTDARRTLMLAWHDVFPFPDPPTWWTDPIPTVVREADPTIEYESRKSPSNHLR